MYRLSYLRSSSSLQREGQPNTLRESNETFCNALETEVSLTGRSYTDNSRSPRRSSCWAYQQCQFKGREWDYCSWPLGPARRSARTSSTWLPCFALPGVTRRIPEVCFLRSVEPRNLVPPHGRACNHIEHRCNSGARLGDHPPHHPLSPPGAPTRCSSHAGPLARGISSCSCCARSWLSCAGRSPTQRHVRRSVWCSRSFNSSVQLTSGCRTCSLLTPFVAGTGGFAKAKWHFSHRVVSRPRISLETQVLVWRMTRRTTRGATSEFKASS